MASSDYFSSQMKVSQVSKEVQEVKESEVSSETE